MSNKTSESNGIKIKCIQNHLAHWVLFSRNRFLNRNKRARSMRMYLVETAEMCDRDFYFIHEHWS